MKKFLPLIWLGVAFGCGEVSQGTNPELSAVAILDYSLPADGCDWNFRIGESTYAPSLATRPMVVQFGMDQKLINSDTVQLKYRLTGNHINIQCGWGTTSNLPEIEVLSLAKK